MNSSHSLQVRNATADDIPLLRTLGEACFLPTYLPFIAAEQVAYMFDKMYSEAALKKQMTELNHRFFIVYKDEVPIAFASFQNDFPQAGTAKLHKLYVLPEVQGSGAGRFLLQTVERAAQELGAMQLMLNVNRYNKALHFYERCGFSVLREDDIHIGNGWFMNDYEMIKSLA